MSRVELNEADILKEVQGLRKAAMRDCIRAYYKEVRNINEVENELMDSLVNKIELMYETVKPYKPSLIDAVLITCFVNDGKSSDDVENQVVFLKLRDELHKSMLTIMENALKEEDETKWN